MTYSAPTGLRCWKFSRAWALSLPPYARAYTNCGDARLGNSFCPFCFLGELLWLCPPCDYWLRRQESHAECQRRQVDACDASAAARDQARPVPHETRTVVAPSGRAVAILAETALARPIILRLQRQAGNAAVTMLLSARQTPGQQITAQRTVPATGDRERREKPAETEPSSTLLDQTATSIPDAPAPEHAAPAA